ncbi:MAG: bacteriophage Gp15 family protein, partial [Fusicatenibacter sp.]|nr:bacteriophage Gp15 family protein [Fusicatenibacter sp.]
MIGGKEYQIYSDFRTSILFESMMRNPELKSWEKLNQMLLLYYPVIPLNRQEAIEKALWFYNCGEDREDQQKERNQTRKEFRQDRVSYSFDQDAPYIYAAFMGTYHMNLQRIPSAELHWWEFIALFDSLPDDCKIRKIMYWRTCDTSGMPRKEVQRINELRKRYELKDDVSIQ